MGYLEITGRSVAWLFRAGLVFVCIAKVYYADYLAAILFLLAFGLSMMPVLLNQLYDTKLPWALDLIVAYMLFAHMSGFLLLYDVWPFWDDIGHTIGSMAITVIGFFIVYVYDYTSRIKVTKGMMMLFAVLWTMALGGVWEIIEFIWDFIVSASGIVTATGQYGFAQNGLFDTMTDLTIDLVGSLVAATGCLFFVRHAKKRTIEHIVAPVAKILGKKKPPHD